MPKTKNTELETTKKVETVKPSSVTYYTLSKADFYLPAFKNSKGLRVELHFHKHKMRLTESEHIDYVEGLKKEGKCGILSYEEFIEQTDPDKAWLDVDGINIHIKEVKRLVRFALDNGETVKEVTVIDNSGGTIQGTRGGVTSLI